MFNRKIVNEIIDKIEEKENENRIPKNLVQVVFNDGPILTYFSDLTEIKKGDLVTVEGKKEGQIGLVIKVLSSFKKPKFDMKWITAKIDNDISGNYFKIDNDIVSLDTNLTIDKFMNMYVGEKYEENSPIGEDNLELNLEKIEESTLFVDELVKHRGFLLYKVNAVQYIWLKDGVGKAVVRSSKGNEWYEIDFRCKKGRITYIACDCPYFGECKHLYAFLLKLRDFSKKFYAKYQSDNFVMCNASCFKHIMVYGKGKAIIEL